MGVSIIHRPNSARNSHLFDSSIKPRKTHQIVLSHRAMEYATRVRWSLKRVVETDILSHEDLGALQA